LLDVKQLTFHPSLTAMASLAASHYLAFDMQWASLALLWYDYALTFPMEVRYMWGTKFRLSTLLYILCRYALVANILYLIAAAGWLHQSCDTWYKISGALSVLGRTAVLVTFTGRVYAVWGRSRIILAYLVILALACIALDITHVPGLRCKGSTNIPIVDHLLTILMIVFESSSAILTIIRSIQAFRVGGSSWSLWKEGLSYMIFEEGIMYFCIISAFTTATLILIYHAPPGSNSRVLNSLTLPLSGLLTARFLLHIRHWKHKQSLGNLPIAYGMDLGSNIDISTIEFRNESSGSSMMSYLADDFGSDPVARMAADGSFRTLQFASSDPDEPWEAEFGTKGDDDETLTSPKDQHFKGALEPETMV